MLRVALILAPTTFDRADLEHALRADGVVAGDEKSAMIAVLALDGGADASHEVSTLRERMRGRPIIVIGPALIDAAVASMRAGASDYLPRPIDGARLRGSVARLTQSAPPPFREARRRFEETYVRHVLAAARGRVAEAARLAGRERKDFYQLCKRAGVDLAAYRVAGDQAVESVDGVVMRAR